MKTESALVVCGLTREAVLRITATFPPPRRGFPEPPEGKRPDSPLRSAVLASLMEGRRTTTELAEAARTNDEGVRLTLRRLREAGKVRQVKSGKPGVGGWPAEWELVTPTPKRHGRLTTNASALVTCGLGNLVAKHQRK